MYKFNQRLKKFNKRKREYRLSLFVWWIDVKRRFWQWLFFGY
jgi:hypothetical protein